jgi:hypothetical protein
MEKVKTMEKQSKTQATQTLSTIGVRKVPILLKEAFVAALIEEKVGQQSLFLMWIIRLVVAHPKRFIQMCRDLEQEIDEEKLNLTH